MIADNPVCLAALNILKQTEESVSLYNLIQSIEKEILYLIQDEQDSSHELMLFKKNFIVMNALYQIQKDIKGTGYSLYISPLKIIFFSEGDLKTGLPSVDIEEAERVDASMSKYYLDWSNYKYADDSTVEQLLNSFWREYQKINKNDFDQDKRSHAFYILGVESSASWNDIQHAYRQKIATCHPDKGGSSHQFIEIREAFLLLKLSQ